MYCETGDTRTAKIESFFSGLFSCGAPSVVGGCGAVELDLTSGHPREHQGPSLVAPGQPRVSQSLANIIQVWLLARNARKTNFVYVFQMFPSGDDSLLSNISGYAGTIDSLASQDLITEYRKQISNSLPINIDNPIRAWNIKSGSFVTPEASLLEGSVFIEFTSQEAYNMWYQTA